MTFVLRGEVDIRIEDEVHRYRQGDVCLLNRNTYHAEQVCSNVTLAFLCFSPQMMVEYSGYPFADFYPENEMDFAHFFESDCENCPEGTKSFLEFHRCTQEGQGAAEELLFQIRQELLLQSAGMHVYAIWTDDAPCSLPWHRQNAIADSTPRSRRRRTLIWSKKSSSMWRGAGAAFPARRLRKRCIIIGII